MSFYALEFVVVLATAAVLAPLAPRFGLLAHPGEHRAHDSPTPMVGGIAIMAGLLIAAFSFADELLNLLPALLLIFTVGLLDDRLSLPSWIRLIAQGASIYAMVLGTQVELTSLGELWPSHDSVLGSWSLPLTIFAGIGVINAVNMSDGMDGLAGLMVIATLIGLSILIGGFSPIMLVTLIGVCGFLLFNLRIGRPQAKIFLGDAGSTLLGLLLTYLLVKYSQGAERLILPVTALWLLALPLFDAVAVLILRPIRGLSPFAADRIHYHHLLQERGLSVNQTLVVTLALQSALIVLGILMLRLETPAYMQLAGFLVLFITYLCFLASSTKGSKDHML